MYFDIIYIMTWILLKTYKLKVIDNLNIYPNLVSELNSEQYVWFNP